MDVVDARTDLVGIGKGLEGFQKLHAGAGALDGDHVGIHGGDGGHDVVELRIAHVGVNLGGRVGATGRHAKGPGRPVEIVVPVLAPQWQGFAKGGLVDLDETDTSAFQIGHLLPQSQGNFHATLPPYRAFFGKGPLEDGHRTGEHALDGALG